MDRSGKQYTRNIDGLLLSTFTISIMKKLILLFYLIWTTLTIICFNLPLPQNSSDFQLNLVLYFFTGTYLLLASSLSLRVIRQVMEEKPGRVTAAIVGSVALFFFLYLLNANFNFSPIIMVGISTANLLFCASLIGTVLSSAIRRPGELVPVCLTSAIADFMSVMTGPTKIMAEDISTYYDQGMTGEPPFVDFILIKAGIPGFAIPLPLFGITDWILLILLSSALLRMGENDNLLAAKEKWKNYIYLPISVLALFGSLLFAQITQRFVPAMVFIALFFLIYLVVRMKIHRKLQKTDMVYSFVFPAMVAALLFLFNN